MARIEISAALLPNDRAQPILDGRIRAEGGFLDRPADLTVTFQCRKLGHALAPGMRLE